MKKNKAIDRSINTDVLGFQVRESYKAARTNIAYSILKKAAKGSFYIIYKKRGQNSNLYQCCVGTCSAGCHQGACS